MSQRKKRSSPLRIVVLLILVAGALYVNQVVVPATPPLFISTPTPTRAPESFLKDAQDLIAKGKINQAIEMYKEAVKADPRNPAIYVTLARWQVLYGDYSGAMENVENALLVNPNHALAKAVRGWILGKQGEFLAGETELDAALTLDPNSALAYAYLAELYLDRISANQADLNTLDKAIKASQTAKDKDPGLLEVHRVRGLVLQSTTNHAEAIKEFEAAIAMNENLADLYVSLGVSYRLTDQTGKAQDTFLRAIALRPDDALPYSELAATYLKAGEFAKGIQYAEEAVKRSPEDPFLYGLLGTMYFKVGQYSDSVQPLRLAMRGGLTQDGTQVTALGLDAQDAASVAYMSRFGIALANIGQCGEALQISQELLQKIPNDENVAYNAQVMIDTCRDLADNPPPDSTETPVVTETPKP
ncbi:MAG: tetratricopeptide repeat protein [Anaerolineaceae bacterium]|nr:tetratricopeptide repeat protein [Anaerolineaceae bacterium]